MRKIFAILILLTAGFAGNLNAQSFEGIIKWRISFQDVSISQPEKSGGDDMSDALKQLEEQMNDPEFRKQLEQNPQMKEMIEQNMDKLKGIQQAGGLNNVVPQGVNIKIKNNNSLIQMDGGLSALVGDILYLNEKKQSYSVRRNNRTYSALPQTQSGKKQESRVTKTTETISIAGYNCTKYLVETEEDGKKTVNSIWTTQDVAGLDPQMFQRMSYSDSGNGWYNSKVPGLPLKIETRSGDSSMIMEVVEIKKQTLPDSDFKIPSDYKLTNF